MLEKDNVFDLIIIGSGPAGLTASIYASRYGIKHLVIGSLIGGLASEAHKICNFPTYEEITGIDFSKRLQRHAESYGIKVIIDQVININKGEKIFIVKTRNNRVYQTKTLLLAMGTERRRLNIPGEKEFLGKGVSYCATCDGPFFKNKVVGVVGGSDAAVTAALYLANIAKKVYIIYRRNKLRAEKIWVDQVKKNKRIEVIYNANIIGLEGKDVLEFAILDKLYYNSKKLKIDGLFIEIGSVPASIITNNLGIAKDDYGYVKIDKNGQTNVSGVWAAGDLTDGSDLKQIITACAQGAIAVYNIQKSLRK